MARYFRFPFASQGDKVVFPDTSQADGSLSYNQGYGPDYQRNPATDSQARRPDRSRFNQLLFDVTSTLQLYYQEAYPPFITADNNGGAAFEYPIYARVRFDSGSGDRIYESLKNNNTSLPTVTADWRLADFTGLDARYLQQAAADARYLLESNNLSDLTNTNTARINLGLGTAATLSTGTATGNIARIGTPGTTAAGNDSAVVVRAGSNANGNYRVWSDGFIEQWGTTPTLTTINQSQPLPIPYPQRNADVVVSDSGGQNFNYGGFIDPTTGSNLFATSHPRGGSCRYFSLGF